jgi:predicted ferric reductase
VSLLADTSPAWFTSRAAGITALFLCTLSVVLGLAKATGLMPARVGGVTFRALHEALGIAALAMIALHGVSLLLDPFLRPGLAGVVVPFASPFRPVATAAGQIAAYGLVVLALGFYARRMLGAARWRRAHALIPIFWLLAAGHSLALGTDRGAWWFLASLGLPAFAAIVLLAVRLDRDWLARPASVRQSPSTLQGAGSRRWGQGAARDVDAVSRARSPRSSLW